MSSNDDDDDDDMGVGDEPAWEDLEGDDAGVEPCLCLVCTSQLTSVEAAVAHMADAHALDLVVLLCQIWDLDEYGMARFVNYMRQQAGTWTADAIQAMTKDTVVLERLRADESLLRPVLPTDPLLYELSDVVTQMGAVSLSSDPVPKATSAPTSKQDTTEQQLTDTERVELEKAAVAFPAVRALLDRMNRQTTQLLETGTRLSEIERSFRNYKELTEAALRPETGLATADDDFKVETAAHAMDYYFSGYSHYGIHEEMLKDDVRTVSYGYFMDSHKDAFRDKVVLDVGCGTGILSMFAARAGARKVYAVDASNIIDQAKANVAENGLDQTIELMRGKMEDLVLPEKVDVIISEWMGYFLLYESMLDTVLLARDRWLKRGGHVYPVLCTMKIAGLNHTSWTREHFDFWDNVYGFKMSAMKPLLFNDAAVDHVHSSVVSTSVSAFKLVDAEKVQLNELEFSSPFTLTAQCQHTLNAFITYFDVDFDPDDTNTPTRFTTGPFGDQTHWKQTILYLKTPLELTQGDVIEGYIDVHRSQDNTRTLTISLSYSITGSNIGHQQSYQLS